MKEFIDWLGLVMWKEIESVKVWFKHVPRNWLIAVLERWLFRLRTVDEIRFNRAWEFMSPAERKALQSAKGAGLLRLREQYIDKYIDEDGHVRPEFFNNRGFNNDFDSIDPEENKPP